jgi:chemotaxis methyl-accepting protein methylase
VAGAEPEFDTAVREILAELRRRTGMDFSGYRRSTVERRIANRMVSVGVDSHEAYLAVLASSAGEAERLLDRLAIKVSRFYRHAPAFDLLRRELLPALARSRTGAPLRLWSAGCGHGEEAYTLALLLDEGGYAGRVEATDIDSAALAAAGRGVYPLAAADELPPELAARYLAPVHDGERITLHVADALRERVHFTRHDLLFAAMPGGGGFDLVSCRNVLIYLQAESRREALRALCRALRPGGLLLLGEAEWPTHGELALAQVGRAERIFRAMEGA